MFDVRPGSSIIAKRPPQRGFGVIHFFSPRLEFRIAASRTRRVSLSPDCVFQPRSVDEIEEADVRTTHVDPFPIAAAGRAIAAALPDTFLIRGDFFSPRRTDSMSKPSNFTPAVPILRQ